MTQGKLPLPWTEFIGRERERVSLKRLLIRARLVTVVGLCGVGKSRLALQVLEDLQADFEGRIWFVPCDELADAAAIVSVVRGDDNRRGSSEPDGGGEKGAEGLISALAGQRALLYLDTAECLLASGLRELLPRLLEGAPQLTVLLTSQAETGLAGEHLFPLHPMFPPVSLSGSVAESLLVDAPPEALPRGGDGHSRGSGGAPRGGSAGYRQGGLKHPRAEGAPTRTSFAENAVPGNPFPIGGEEELGTAFPAPSYWLQADALRLFEARAQQRNCDWQLTPANLNTVVALCREIDWLPLGIELLSTQLSPWTETQLLDQIRRRGHQLDLTTPGRLTRHRSLRAAIDWSWSLLPTVEQELLAMLASLGGQVFEESLEPLTGIREAPLLAAALYRKGFLQIEERAGRLRYSLLETVCRFVLEQETPQASDLGRAAAYYLETVVREGERLGTSQAADAAEVLRLETPMLGRCWAWVREQGEPTLLRGFTEALQAPLLHELPIPTGARELALAAVSSAQERGESVARLAWVAGTITARLDSIEQAAALLRGCLEPEAPDVVRALALKEMGLVQLHQGQLLAACDTLQQSVSALSQLSHECEQAWARRALGLAYEQLGDREGAERLVEEARLQFVELELPAGQGRTCADLAHLAAEQGHWEIAEVRAQEALRIYQSLGHGSGVAEAALVLARVRVRQGAVEEARHLYGEALTRLRTAGMVAPLCRALLQAAAEQQPHVSPLEPTKAYRECISLAGQHGLRSLLARAMRGLADAYATDGRIERAFGLAEEAVQIARETTETPLIQSCLELLGQLREAGASSEKEAPAPARLGPSGPVLLESVSVREAAGARTGRTDRKRLAGSSNSLDRGRTSNWPPTANARRHAGAAAGPVRIRLLGGMSLLMGEDEVPLLDWWAKAKKLFAYLAINRGRPVSRDILLEEFWPDGDQQRAVHSLQTTLSFLRRSLRALPGGQALADRLIVARDGNYLFDGEGRCETDLHLFDEHFQEGMRLKGADRLDEAAVHWIEGDRLYAGDLLPDFPYEDWCASPRERLRSRYLDLLLNLALYHRQAQRPREALRAAERMFIIDSCDERAHRMVMRCHVQMGRPVDALRQFERCTQMLERELRVQPSKQTRDLHELIRHRMARSEPAPAEVNETGESLSTTTI